MCVWVWALGYMGKREGSVFFVGRFDIILTFLLDDIFQMFRQFYSLRIFVVADIFAVMIIK